ncbi:MAG: phosphotransferase [Anaerolineales bacterium]|nr:phosphotransferase [Anaerolineales bacterium]
MNLSPEIEAILHKFQVQPDALLGHGGEAFVFALDDGRILRIAHAGTSQQDLIDRAALLSELAPGAAQLPFAIPAVLEIHQIDNRVLTIEPRLPGRPLPDVLLETGGSARANLIRAYLDAAARLGDLSLHRPWYGEIRRDNAIRTAVFADYLVQRAAAGLQAGGAAFRRIDPQQLAAALPTPDQPEFVHLDAFAGNMLAADGKITAVLDFGAVCLMGDRRLDPLTAAIYLTPAITPSATDDDRAVAQAWLVEHDLDVWFEPAQRWIAAFWAFAHNDKALFEWCQSVLLA